MRESSPPEAILRSGWASWPGLVWAMNSTWSKPVGVAGEFVGVQRRGGEGDSEGRFLHPEFGELGFDQRREFLGDGGTFGGEGGAELFQLAAERVELLLQDGAVLSGPFESVELGSDLGPQGESGFDVAAILVQHAVQGVEAVVHLGQLAGVEVELVEVAAQVEGGFLQVQRGVADGGGGVAERGVERGEFGQHGGHHLQAFEHAAVGLVQRGVHGAGVFFQLLEVHQHAGAGLQLGVLGGVEFGGVDLVRLEAVELQLLLAERLVGAEFVQLFGGRLQLVVDGGVLLAEGKQVAELVDHVELVRGLEQVLVVVLAVHVDQVLADGAEHGQRDGRAVQRDAAAARGVELAGEQDFAAVGGDVDVGGGGDALLGGLVADFEDAADFAFVGAGSEHLGGAAQAEQHFDGADHQALAGAGRPGETVQARAQLNAGVGDDGQVVDVQFAKHATCRFESNSLSSLLCVLCVLCGSPCRQERRGRKERREAKNSHGATSPSHRAAGARRV